MPSFEFLSYLKDLNGPQLIVFVVIVLVIFSVIVLAGLVRFWFVSGKDKFDAGIEDKRDALSLLEKQVERLEKEVSGLGDEIRLMREADTKNREYRHALVNQNQILVSSLELTLELLREIADAWEAMPEYFKHRIRRFKMPGELLRNSPLPRQKIEE